MSSLTNFGNSPKNSSFGIESPILVRKWLGPKTNPGSIMCHICESEDETLSLYNHARAVWFGSNLAFLVHSASSIDIVEWWGNLIKLN